MGIGNFMSSHSLSAGHVPLGLGRDNLFTSPKDKFVIKEYLDIVDGGQFNEYCWGRDVFSFTVESMKGKMLRVQKKRVGYHYYRLNGFPLVLQV